MKALLKRLTPSFLYKVHCNICGGSFRKPFVEFGIVPRHNARCWNCWSLERHRILWKYLNDETDFLKRPIKLLHVAPEACFYPLLDSNVSIEYHPGDLSPDAYPHKGKSSVVKTDLTRLQYDDAFFDLVIANHVLEHIPEDRKAMAEIYRVLKPGGTAVVMTPVNNHPKPEGYTAETTYEDFSI